MTPRRSPWLLPLLLTALVIGGSFCHLSSPVRDAVTEQAASGFHLEHGRGYDLLAPWCSAADQLTILSYGEIKVCLTYLLVAALVLPRRWKTKMLSLLAILGFVAWGALCPRPVPRLVADDPTVLLIDFHSHTAFSHDGRKSFSPERNMEWHRRQGFNAAFITDHNVATAAQEAKEISTAEWRTTGYRSLQGDEASLFRTHLCVFAPHVRIDNSPYDSAFERIPAFLAAMHRQGYLVTANLPEYWRFHWQVGLMDFQTWDVDGFEIANSAPRALDFPAPRKREIIQFCRARNLFIDGVSDNHGWGSTTSVWNAIRIAGWQQMDPDQLEQAVLKTLRRDRFQAVQVLERAKYFPETTPQLLLSPLADAVVWARSLGPIPALFCLLWIWGIAFLVVKLC